MTAAESALLGLSEPTARVRTGRESGPGKVLDAPAGAYSVSHQLIEPGGIGRMTHPTKHKATVRRNPATLRWQVSCTCGYRWSAFTHQRAMIYALHHAHLIPKHSNHAELSMPSGCPSCGACACYISAHDFTYGARLVCDSCRRVLVETTVS